MMTWFFVVTLNLSLGPTVIEIGPFDSKSLCEQEWAYFNVYTVLPERGAAWSKSICQARQR